MRKRRSSCQPWLLLFFGLAALLLLGLAVILPAAARQSFGAPSAALPAWQKLVYGTQLVWHSSDLVDAADPTGAEQLFTVQPGEGAGSIADNLQVAGLIRSASIFRTYLAWSGRDTLIQSGTYRISPAQSARDIADTLGSLSQTELTFSVLAGWRGEEIAASLPTSGLSITPGQFLAEVARPAHPPDFLPVGASAEGFLAPGRYVLDRSTDAAGLVSILLQGFSDNLTSDLSTGFSAQGLSLYQAVTLASIIQREAMQEVEMPVIASVFYNRLADGMPLQSDPTVQYALGYNTAQSTWWTNPLSAEDLQVDSPFNTYFVKSLPPGPISEPGLAALQAVAHPAQTGYFYFQAKCDGSGLHNFAVTLDEHLHNNCP